MIRLVQSTLLMAAALALVAAPTAANFNVPWMTVEADDPEWHTAYLGWSQEKGNIAWTPNLPGDDHKPALPDDATQQKRQEDYRLEAIMDTGPFNNYATSGFHFTEAIPDDVFESAALDERLHLNASRGIQVVLLLKNNPSNPGKACQYLVESTEAVSDQRAMEPNLELELRADGKIIGGANGEDDLPGGFEAPDGYGACRFQMHPEVHVLEPGTVLKLVIRHAKQQFFYSYGLSGSHQSFMQFGLLPAEERFYRFPEQFEENEEPFVATNSIAGLLGLLALSVPRRRATRALVAVLLVASFSGCLGQETHDLAKETQPGPSGSVENTLVKDVEGVLTPKDVGALLGRVRDDLQIPIPGVHVAVLGKSNFTTTDAKGKFQFRDLLPGMYNLRFDHTEYKTYEVEVPVQAGFVSRPDFTLFLINPKVRDERPHPHDYWDGKTTLDAGSFTAVCAPYVNSLTKPRPVSSRPADDHCWAAGGYLKPHADGSPNLVNPGTTDVEVKLEWSTNDLRADKLGIAVWTIEGESVYAPRGPGEVFHIATTWEMTDEGHSARSDWWFQWFLPVSGERDWQERRDRMSPTYTEPAVTFHVKIHRGGAIPLGRAHPDLWEGKDTLIMDNFYSEYSSASPFPPGVEAPAIPCPAGDCRTEFGHSTLEFWNQDNDVVPGGTQWLEVTLTRLRTPSPYYDWELRYRPANQTEGYSWDEKGYTGVTRGAGSTDEILKFRIPITNQSMTDSPYARMSGWYFRAVPSNDMNHWQDYWSNYPQQLFAGGTEDEVALKVIVHRDEMPA